MGSWSGPRLGNRTRNALVVLTLLSHLMATFGFPLPTATATKSNDASAAFPCQNRPCGCLSSEECWAGDCCCFTLEEKLVWADANGVEPPDHVRPLVASRKARPSAPPPKERAACCCDADHEGLEAPTSACPTGDQRAKEPTHDRASARWVVGLFAQKCRSDGPAGLFQAEPALPPDPISDPIPSIPARTLIDRPCRAASASHRPPTPPPRQA
jgi:hypothetical protein